MAPQLGCNPAASAAHRAASGGRLSASHLVRGARGIKVFVLLREHLLQPASATVEQCTFHTKHQGYRVTERQQHKMDAPGAPGVRCSQTAMALCPSRFSTNAKQESTPNALTYGLRELKRCRGCCSWWLPAPLLIQQHVGIARCDDALLLLSCGREASHACRAPNCLRVTLHNTLLLSACSIPSCAACRALTPQEASPSTSGGSEGRPGTHSAHC